jgi:hypothetical protein
MGRLAELLSDTAQGASNAVASNVSAPVDAIAWLLRNAGVPVGDAPVGGSDWMAQKGLTRRPTNRIAGLVGETLGMTGPMVAAAKAPQIAGGLLKAMDNAAIPATLNPQTGAIVYHGSPYKFDRFDFSKIGTGEGAQAYGHGGYLAEARGTGEEYRKALAGKDKGMAGQIAARALQGRTPESAIDHLSNSLVGVTPEAKSMTEQAIELVKQGNANQGYLYKVDLPDDQIAKMLDWDKPLSQQAPEVQQFVTEKLQAIKPEMFAKWSENGAIQHAPLGSWFNELAPNTQNGGNARAALSAEFQKQGIPGIRYLDGGSRGAGQGTSNYVVFPGNEDLLTILERNGRPIK